MRKCGYMLWCVELYIFVTPNCGGRRECLLVICCKVTQVSISGLAPYEEDEEDGRDQKTQVKLSCTGQIQIAQSYT